MAALEKSDVLVVGDGNFSFSVRYLETCGPNCHLTATSLDTLDVLKRDHVADQNIDTLRKTKLVSVAHGIDATNLQAHFSDRKFNEIIFNFPHVGGKSNVRRCRELIKDFFASASSCLKPSGKVLVALCRGQGGTPSDDRKRGYKNSWMIATEAAKSGFVLVAIKPYTLDTLSYSCAGYRGQLQKGFLMKGSLGHYFKQGPQLHTSIGRPLSDRNSFNSELQCTLQDGYDKASSFKQLLSAVVEKFTKELSTSLSKKMNDFKSDACTTDKADIIWNTNGHFDQNDLNNFLLEFSKSSEEIKKGAIQVARIENKRPFNSCAQPPFYHEIILLFRCNKHMSHSCVKEAILEAIRILCHDNKCSVIDDGIAHDNWDLTLFETGISRMPDCTFDKDIPHFVEDLDQNWVYADPEITVTNINSECSSSNLSSEHVQYETVKKSEYSPSPVEMAYKHSNSIINRSKLFCFNEVFTIQLNGEIVTKGGVVNIVTPEPLLKEEANSFLAAAVHVENILGCRYGVNDYRLFTSSDSEYLNALLDEIKFDRNTVPRPTVVHPLCYRHDLCFWLDYDISEEFLFKVIQYTTKGLAHSLKLLRILNHKESKAVSYCYRIIYSRCDGPLSKKNTVDIQNQLRIALLHFGFKLR